LLLVKEFVLEKNLEGRRGRGDKRGRPGRGEQSTQNETGQQTKHRRGEARQGKARQGKLLPDGDKCQSGRRERLSLQHSIKGTSTIPSRSPCQPHSRFSRKYLLSMISFFTSMILAVSLP